MKISGVKLIDAKLAEITYDYDSEVVPDRSGLTAFTVYLPEDFEAINAMKVSAIASCSFEPGYVDNEFLLSVYWTPFASRCSIPFQTIHASLTSVSPKITYPDYPRLVKDGVISVAILVGKMEEDSYHNPYRGDESTSEYRQVLKRMKKLGFVRTKVTPVSPS